MRSSPNHRCLWVAAFLWVTAFLFISFLPVGISRAYVQTTTSDGQPINWFRSCIFLTPDSEGTGDVGAAASLQAINSSAESWNSAAWSCDASIQFIVEEPRDQLKRGFTIKGTNRNVVVWLTDHWGDDEVDYDSSVVALTTITFVSDPGAEDHGEILDADVEFNGVNHEFFVTTPGDAGAHDIQNTLTHELGHILGLDHPCYDGAVNPRPTDHEGEPIPDCQPQFKLPETILESTMYNFTESGETKKRSLEADDVAGICAAYPPTDTPGPCKPVSFPDGSCSCHTLKGTRDKHDFSLLFMGVLMALLYWKKRKES